MYLRETALIREVSSVDEDVSWRKLDGRVVRVRDAYDAHFARLEGRHVGGKMENVSLLVRRSVLMPMRPSGWRSHRELSEVRRGRPFRWCLQRRVHDHGSLGYQPERVSVSCVR